MSWLKRIEPVVLYQTSEIPYVILESGVFLCFNNFYQEKEDKTDYHIAFRIDRNILARKSTHYFAFKNFPVTIPFEDIVLLNDSIVEGSLIKSAAEAPAESREIIVIKDSYLESREDDEFQEIVEVIDASDDAFLLVGDNLGAKARVLDNMVHAVRHTGWSRTSVAIADILCNTPRKYCWTKSIPEVTINCHGFKRTEDMDKFKRSLENIGIEQFSIIWI